MKKDYTLTSKDIAKAVGWGLLLGFVGGGVGSYGSGIRHPTPARVAVRVMR